MFSHWELALCTTMATLIGGLVGAMAFAGVAHHMGYTTQLSFWHEPGAVKPQDTIFYRDESGDAWRCQCTWERQ